MAYQFEEESRKDAKRGLILERVYSTRKIPEKLNTIDPWKNFHIFDMPRHTVI